MLKKLDGSFGVKVGNKTVFTRQGAIDTYKRFCKICYRDLTMEASCVLSDVADDMHAIGFGYDELEEIEIEVIKNMGDAANGNVN